VSYDVLVEEKPEYLRVEVSGTRVCGEELSSAICVWEKLGHLCREKALSKVLVVVNLTGRLPTMSAYGLAESPGSFGWERSFKAAIVDVNESSRESNNFTVTVAKNRGYNVEIFESEKTAREWLLGGK